MKIAKILSAAAASVVAAAALAASASAVLVVPETQASGASIGTGGYLVQVFNVGNPDEGKPATDYGIDLTKVAAIEVVLEAVDPDWFDGNPGGGITFSCNGGDITNPSDLWDTYNWPGTWSYWGVNDDTKTNAEGNPYTAAADQGIQANHIGDADSYQYLLHADIVNPLVASADQVDELGCMQVGVQYWGSDMSDYKVVKCDVLDASGNVMLSFDETGAATVGGTGSTGDTGSTVVDTTAPAAGDNKGNVDTGVEGVAAVAGLAVVAAGAVALSKKRK